MAEDKRLGCRIPGCRATAAPGLPAGANALSERLCMDHFLEQARQVLAQATECCREGRALAPATLEQLSHDVNFVAQFLSAHGRTERSPRRSHMVELLLGFANLREHLQQGTALRGAS